MGLDACLKSNRDEFKIECIIQSLGTSCHSSHFNNSRNEFTNYDPEIVRKVVEERRQELRSILGKNRFTTIQDFEQAIEIINQQETLKVLCDYLNIFETGTLEDLVFPSSTTGTIDPIDKPSYEMGTIGVLLEELKANHGFNVTDNRRDWHDAMHIIFGRGFTIHDEGVVEGIGQAVFEHSCEFGIRSYGLLEHVPRRLYSLANITFSPEQISFDTFEIVNGIVQSIKIVEKLECYWGSLPQNRNATDLLSRKLPPNWEEVLLEEDLRPMFPGLLPQGTVAMPRLMPNKVLKLSSSS